MRSRPTVPAWHCAAATGEAVERLVGGGQPLAPTTHDLLPCLVTALGSRVEDCLERLRADLGGWLALLTHDSGTLVAWAGPGDPAAIAGYCQARADHDADLTHLLTREVYPPDQVEAVVFRSVARLWRIEVGIAAEDSKQERERFAHRTDQAVGELEPSSGEHRCRQAVRPR